MRLNKRLILALLSIALVIPMVTSPGNHQESITTGSSDDAYQAVNPTEGSDSTTPQSPHLNPLTLSQDVISGTLSPARVTHSGYQVSSLVKARTDTGTNMNRNVTIGTANGWFASQAEVEVTDSRRLYALNGTFDSGVLPWVNSTYDPSGGLQSQTATYNSTLEHIGVANVGDYYYNPGTKKTTYTHYELTEILWTQAVINLPLATDFLLSFEFLYASGPLDPDNDDWLDATVDVELRIYVNGDIYYLSLLYGGWSRNTWYSISDYPINVAGAPSSFDIQFGLYIPLYASTTNLVLDTSRDYDDDGVPGGDGLENARTIDVRLDNIAFDGVVAPGFEETDMRFHAGELEIPVTGTGSIGTAIIVNPSFWATDPLQVEVTSNSTISFTYKVTLLVHQYVNTSWTSDPTKPGVSYTMTQGHSVFLKTFTYVAASYGLENVTIDIEHPSDWVNVTVLDPLLNDLTLQCDVNPGLISISTDLLSRVGWWEIRLNGPNYAENLITQKYDETTGQWSGDSLFRAGNVTRVHAELGTATSTPTQGNPAQISWIMPNGTVWEEESIVTMVNGALNGTSWTLDGLNTTAGRWVLELFWANGTEIAFAATGFDMYHASSLTAVQSVIETEAGSVITSILRYVDIDNGQYLMQEEAAIAADWSPGSVTYGPNLVRNWWEADFDTSLVGGGEFLIIVNAMQSYYDDASCQFTLRVFYETTLDVTSIGGLLATTGYLENYTFCMSYLFTNSSPVNGAEIALEYAGPENGLLSLGWRSLGNGNYSISVRGLISGLYAVTVTGTKPYHYSASDTFALLVTEANTALSSLNGTSDLVRIGETYRLVVHYENNSGGGLAGASIVLDSVTPSSGITCTDFTYVGNGNYYTDLTPAVSGTYTLVIRASLDNHMERVVSFTVTAIVTPTVLTVSTATAMVTMDQTYTVQLLLLDDQSSPVMGATISVLNPPSGLDIQTYVPLPGGHYNVTIIPLQVGTYQISFRASLVNCLNSTVGFVLVASYVPTSLSIQDSVTLVTTGLNEIITLYLTYEMLNSTPVAGANVVLNYTGPEEGLGSLGHADLGLGNYSFSLRAVGAGLYTVTLTGSKQGLYPAYDSFTLLVIATGTNLSSLNGTSGMVRMGYGFRLVMHYENNSGGGLAGADVSVDGVTPSSGLTYGIFTYAGDGNYYVDLTPTTAGTYTLVIRASLYNHVERVASFTVTAVVTPTVLTVSSPGASVAIDQTYTVQLLLVDDESNPVMGATISVLNPPSGLLFQDCVPLPEGRYNITIQPLQTGTYQIAFRASCENYGYSTEGFTLVVGYIPTNLAIQGGASSDSIHYSENCTVTVSYSRTDLSQAIEGAQFGVTSVPDTGLTWQVTNTTDGYRLMFKTNATGIWAISITSNKTGYVNGFVQFELEVMMIPSTINEISLVQNLICGRSYAFTFNYLMYNTTGIEGATISVEGSGTQWVSWTETGSGHYRVTVAPATTGTYSITLTFDKEGCDVRSSSLSFVIVPASMAIVNIEGLDAMEGETTTLRITLVDSTTGNPIGNASVTFQAVTSTGLGDLFTTEETSPGVYEAAFTMPSFGTSEHVRIYASLDNYALDQENYEVEILPRMSETAQLNRTILQASPFIFVFSVALVGLSARRVSMARKRKWNIQALSTKRRFDDMKSLIGVIVLHRVSGLPIYHKILRSGLDESLIAGFISAITQFRSEFGVDEAEWTVVPISDIIRVVRTKNLLIAFITLGPPTESQEAKLLEFAKAVGLLFDSVHDTPPTGTIDFELLDRYEEMFNEVLDGRLLSDYRVADDRKAPRNLRLVTEAASRLSTPDKFRLEDLAFEMKYRGIEESMVYVKIIDAIEKQCLVPLPKDVNAPPEVVAHDLDEETDPPGP